MADYLKHPVLNPTGDYSGEFDFPTEYDKEGDEDYKQKTEAVEHIKNTITPAVFANLITGKYGHARAFIDDIARAFAGHKHNNPKNIDKAIEKLVEDGNSDKAEELLKHFHASPEMIDKIIADPRHYGFKSKHKDLEVNNLSGLANQKNLSSDHISKMIAPDEDGNQRPFKADKDFLKHPSVTPEHLKALAGNKKFLPDADAAEYIADTHARTGMLGNEADDLLANMSKNGATRFGSNTQDKLLDQMSPEKRVHFIDEALGRNGGSLEDEDAPPEENFLNWSHGPRHNKHLAESFAGSKHLSPAQADHLMRHAANDDVRFSLFENPHIGSGIADQMHQKWLDDDSHHGYDVDRLKHHLKEEAGLDIDDYYDDAREEVEDENPMSEYTQDLSDEDWVGSSKRRWLEDNDELADASDEEKDAAWDQAVTDAKEGDTPDYIYEGYDEWISDEVADKAQDMLDEEIATIHKNPEHLPKHLTSVAERQSKEDALKNPNTDESEIQRVLDDPNVSPKHLNMAIEHPNANPDSLLRISNTAGIPDKVKEKALEMYQASDRYDGDEKVHTAMDTSKLRHARDFINEKGKDGVIHKRDLEKAGFNLKALGIDKHVDPKGIISSKEVQATIDSTPKTKYGFTHSTYGRAQLHSDEPSKVFQLNLSPEHFKALKEAGVAPTFKNMLGDLNSSGHPVNKHRGIGWVRYTEKPDGIHIDEIQSDIGQNFVRQIEQQAKQLAAQAQEAGVDTLNVDGREVNMSELADSTKRLREKYPNIDKETPIIKQIAFGGEHPNKILHESFLQHLRDTGREGTKVQMWTPESKAPISGQDLESEFTPEKIASSIEQIKSGKGNNKDENALLQWGAKNKIIPANLKEVKEEHINALHDKAQSHIAEHGSLKIPTPLPVHMQETYRAQPNNMGYKPSTYGSISTQNNPKHIGKPTQEAILRKFEEEELRKSGYKKAAAQALYKIKQMQPALEQIKAEKPGVYNSILALTQKLIHVFNGSHKKPLADHVEEHEVQQHLDNAHEEVGHIRPPAKEEHLTHAKPVYGTGAVRTYSPTNEKMKTAQGDWVSVAGHKSVDPMSGRREGGDGQK